jgi:hypothetical protein
LEALVEVRIMGLLDMIKKAFAPITKEDPFFGTIRFQKVGFWEAKKDFAPESRVYEITIDGGEDRPTESQREFYRTLEHRYPTLKEEIAKELLEQLKNWREEFTEEDVWEQFSLESFGLSDLDAGQKEWELVYELKDDGHLFCVILKDWEMQGIRVDG